MIPVVHCYSIPLCFCVSAGNSQSVISWYSYCYKTCQHGVQSDFFFIIINFFWPSIDQRLPIIFLVWYFIFYISSIKKSTVIILSKGMSLDKTPFNPQEQVTRLIIGIWNACPGWSTISGDMVWIRSKVFDTWHFAWYTCKLLLRWCRFSPDKLTGCCEETGIFRHISLP